VAPGVAFGTWDVRTITPGLTASLQDINDARKTAVINNELLVDNAALKETRVTGSGKLKEKD